MFFESRMCKSHKLPRFGRTDFHADTNHDDSFMLGEAILKLTQNYKDFGRSSFPPTKKNDSCVSDSQSQNIKQLICDGFLEVRTQV